MFSNVRSVLSQCNTRIRLLHLLYDIEKMWLKIILLYNYNLIKHGLSTNQSARRVQSILQNRLILCNIFTATVRPILICFCSLSVLRCEDFFPFPTSIVCFKSLPLYTFPNAPSPIFFCKEMSSKRTSH